MVLLTQYLGGVSDEPGKNPVKQQKSNNHLRKMFLKCLFIPEKELLIIQWH